MTLHESTQEEHAQIVKDYYLDYEMVSQSLLKHRVLGVKPPKQSFQPVEGNPIHQGSILDMFIFMPYVYTDNYYLPKLKAKPGGKGGEVIETIYQLELARAQQAGEQPRTTFAEMHDEIEEACKVVDLNQNWAANKRLATVFKNWPYYESLVEATGKAIVSEDEQSDCYRCKNALYLDDHYRDRVLAKANDDSDRYLVLYQQPVTAYVNGTMCKGLLDIVIVDRTFKKIEFFDLKRTERTRGAFPFHAQKLRYDFQISFYDRLLKESSWLDIPGGDRMDITEYEVECGGLIVVFADGEDTTSEILPITDRDMMIGRYGFKELHYIEVDLPGRDEPMRSANRKTHLGYEPALELYRDGLTAWTGKEFSIWT